MRKILIIYPHFPPSNLAGVHRARLFAMHLKEFGWEPLILTVHEQFYEESPDWNLVKLLPPDLRVEKVKAFRAGKFRLIGDIGLRGFFQLYQKAKELIRKERFDFLFIPIPSFYCALLGRFLHASTGIPYGIDYIDPWVHRFPGSEKRFSRHWASTKLARFLEPIAVKKAALISGVAEGYYSAVLTRNPHLQSRVVSGAMPYGGEKSDHSLLENLGLKPYLFEKKPGTLQLVYAGAMLPKAFEPLEAIFQCLAENKKDFENIEFHFIGTGKTADDPYGFKIKSLAEKYGLWESIAFEYPKRIPYLDVLIHLQSADAVFILGSTEPHYTPSKSYQAILAGKAILAVLHVESSAAVVIREANAGLVLSFNGPNDVESIYRNFSSLLKEFVLYVRTFDPAAVDHISFEKYSARAVTKALAGLLNQALIKHETA